MFHEQYEQKVINFQNRPYARKLFPQLLRWYIMFKRDSAYKKAG